MVGGCVPTQVCCLFSIFFLPAPKINKREGKRSVSESFQHWRGSGVEGGEGGREKGRIRQHIAFLVKESCMGKKSTKQQRKV